jgi:hypothetical protein
MNVLFLAASRRLDPADKQQEDGYSNLDMGKTGLV